MIWILTDKHLHKAVVVWANVCRFVLAAVFLFSGFVKANDPMGTVFKVRDYLEAWGLFDLTDGPVPYLTALLCGVFEFTIGGYFLFGIRRWASSMLVLLFMLVMTPLTLWLAIADPISDCGCFGDAILLTNWETFFKNVALLVLAVSFFKWRRFVFKIVSSKVDWLVALYIIAFILFFSVFSFRYLPLFDFRPYHVGADIRKGMEIPEGVRLPVYETVFTYERDGERKDFRLEDIPEDSLWKFVDSRTILKEEGYVPPIQDFSLSSYEDGVDLTEDVLSDSSYTFLLVSPWLDKADDSSMDLINEIYDYSVEHGYRFLCVTASTDEAIQAWQENTGAEYPFALADEIVLKTMVRSNPGLMLLKKGVVVRKWSGSDLPDEYELKGPLDRLPLGRPDPKTTLHKLSLVLGWFWGPLLLLTVTDLIWMRLRNGKERRRRAVRDNDGMADAASGT